MVPSFCCITVISAIIIRLYYQANHLEFIICGAFLIIVFFIQAFFRTGSGGDIFFMGMFGYCAGLTATVFSLIAAGISIFGFYGTRYIIKKIRHQDVNHYWSQTYPVAPFVTVGFIMYLILSLTGALYINLWTMMPIIF